FTVDAGSTACSILTSGKLSIDSGTGSCAITAHKAGNNNYNDVDSTSHTVTVNKANQATFTLTVPTSITYGNTGTASASGGSGTGAVSFSAGALTGCSVDA